MQRRLVQILGNLYQILFQTFGSYVFELAFCVWCASVFPFVPRAQLPKRHDVAIAATGENVWYMYIPRSTAISGTLVYGIIALLMMPFV